MANGRDQAIALLEASGATLKRTSTYLRTWPNGMTTEALVWERNPGEWLIDLDIPVEYLGAVLSIITPEQVEAVVRGVIKGDRLLPGYRSPETLASMVLSALPLVHAPAPVSKE